MIGVATFLGVPRSAQPRVVAAPDDTQVSILHRFTKDLWEFRYWQYRRTARTP